MGEIVVRGNVMVGCHLDPEAAKISFSLQSSLWCRTR